LLLWRLAGAEKQVMPCLDDAGWLQWVAEIPEIPLERGYPAECLSRSD
jgi:hypothetical protein